MKVLSPETTQYIKGAIASTYSTMVLATTGEVPTSEELETHVSALMMLYCRIVGVQVSDEDIADEEDSDDESWYDYWMKRINK